ncbi:radical SAM family heme chaperone HemW [bacterium]|nr:radical SAM family heme chaperone HemW [bacterium]
MERIAVYIHIPFCLSKCAYCDFYSVKFEESKVRSFYKALIREIENLSKKLKAKTLYLGGGTPTVLPTPLLKDIIIKAKENFQLPKGAELCVEANPETLDEEKLETLVEIGVNRLSIGVQSFNDELLRFLGRVHTADRARMTLRMLKKHGFNDFNIDLIFAIPGQSLNDWRDTLKEALDYQPTHISCYSLTIEPGTMLWKDLAKGKFSLMDEETEAQMFEEAHHILTTAGYIHYEISNYALPGYECGHNLCYWRGEPYLGIGPAAVSYIPPVRYQNPRLTNYIRNKTPKILETVDEKEKLKERIWLGLRFKEGISIEGLDLSPTLEEFIEAGLVEKEGDRIRLTLKGMLVFNTIAYEFWKKIVL